MMTTFIEQPSLFSPPPDDPAPPTSSPPPHCVPRPPDTADTLLAEVERDRYSLLDPRNWRDQGPTDDEILARYRAAGTPTADHWPNVSGHRMYTWVWPTLRLTYHIPEARILAACQACRRQHLQGMLAYARASAIEYSISTELIGRHVWNGDSWAMYTDLARFAHQPTASFDSLVADALYHALHDAIAIFHTTLAMRYRPPSELRPSPRASAETQRQTIETAIAQAREHLRALRTFGHSPSPARTLLDQATIGPRFQDPVWPTLSEGDSLPGDLIDAILRSQTL